MRCGPGDPWSNLHSIIRGEEGRGVKGLRVPQRRVLNRFPWKFYLAASHPETLLLWRGCGGRVGMEVKKTGRNLGHLKGGVNMCR